MENKTEKKHSGLAAFFIHRPVLTIMVSVSLMFLGLMGYLKMGVSLYPSMDIPATLVQTVLPGASPEEVETSVTKYIEEAVNEISGVDEISAYNMEGVSIVFVKFEMDKNADIGIQEVRDKTEQVKSKFPDGTKSPVVLKLDMDASAVLNVVVTGNRDIIELTELAKKKVKEVVENTSGVGSVSIVGGREREIHVTINPLKLYSLQIPITDVTSALAQQNFEIPGGKVEQNHNSYSLRILGRIPSVEDFKNIFVKNKNGVPIKLSDVATVEDSGEYEQQSTTLDGVRCVTLEIKKQSGSNTLQVIDGVKEKIKMIEKTLPPDMKITIMSDQSGSIRASVNTVLEHLFLGAFLAGIMVLVFMGSLRSTFISFLAIPISVVGSFIFMNMNGFTLNNITLLGLTVAVGIVIDDAIVMLENIYRHMEKYDKSPVQAAVDGAKEITATVVATTLSILVIFLPLAYMGGMVGRVLSSYGWTVVFAIALSGVVALTLTPMLCAKMLKKTNGENKLDKIVTNVNNSLVKMYIPVLNWSIHHKIIMVILAFLCIFAIAPMIKNMGGEFFPQEDSGKIQVQVKAEEGTSYTDMKEILAQIENDIRRLPYIKSILTVTGKGGDGLSSFSNSTPTNKGYLEIELEERNKREKIKTAKYIKNIREMLTKYDGLKTSVIVKSDGPSSGKEVQLSLLGPDLNKLMDYANATVAKLSQDSRFRDVDLSVDMAKPEYRVIINRDKANNLGVNVTAVAAALRTMVGGEDDITKYKEGDELYEVRVRVAEEFRNTKEAISALMIPANIDDKNTVIRLDSIADIEEGFGPSQINRKARQREVRVEANLNGLDTRSAMNIMEQAFYSLNADIGYTVAKSGQAKEMGKMFVSFLLAFVLAFVFKYIILCSLMERFTHPIAIIVSLPLTIPFALFALMVTGQTLNIFSLLGMFMLVGVVSKNAILQTDYTNQLRARGYGRTNAILEANKVRLRPILMTTLTLIVSMIPMMISNGEGADTRRSLAIVIVGGQLLSLLVTLLMTPVTYIIVDSIGDWVKNKISGTPIPEDKDKAVILDEVPEKY
ncbi:efflux RND transporter permease subunit [Candidatus Ruminimicrobium bovinum]|uniref:efflux RND transporter permease subunit n=1 Tax=Candidatus Ruminimicrobium bovinum TaxID=3242779 RepID=UPI0039B82424